MNDNNLIHCMELQNDEYYQYFEEKFDLKEFHGLLKQFPDRFDQLCVDAINAFVQYKCHNWDDIKNSLKEFVLMGYDPNKKGKYRTDLSKEVTPLRSFCEFRETKFIRFFSEELGASINDPNLINDYIIGHSFGDEFKLQQEDVEFIQYLIDKGAPVIISTCTKEIFDGIPNIGENEDEFKTLRQVRNLIQ